MILINILLITIFYFEFLYMVNFFLILSFNTWLIDN